MPIQTKPVSFLALLGAFVLATGSTSSRGAVVSVTPPADLVPASVPLSDPGITGLWDVNGDGTNDFNFSFRQPQIAGDVDWQANVFPINGARIIGAFDSTGEVFNPTNLTLGTPINGASSLIGSPVQGILGETFAGASDGMFTGTPGYLGYSLAAGANTFYGWLNLSVARTSGIDFISAAYENTAGTAIAAGAVPEPGTWVMLILGGAAGLMGLRSRRAVV